MEAMANLILKALVIS